MKKILAVDDQQVTLSVIEKLLQTNGFDVVTSTQGTSVARLLESEKPDILVLDIMMPKKDGIENIQELRQAYPELIIVAISSSDIYLDFAKRFGADYCYEKPIMGGQFVELIQGISPTH
jgi:CheY-like chemotaxis protein